MANPQLSQAQFSKANKLLNKIRKEMKKLASNNPELIFAFRRKIYKELTYDERSKPARRKKLKKKIWKKQAGHCFKCKKKLPKNSGVLDRLRAIDGYTEKNVRLICPRCDRKIQEKRGYK